MFNVQIVDAFVSKARQRNLFIFSFANLQMRFGLITVLSGAIDSAMEREVPKA